MRSNLRREIPDEGVTLRRACMAAMVLHLLFGGLAQWWPGLLISAVPAAAEQADPLQFRFIDLPDPVEAVTPKESADLSDINRRVADESQRDDRDDPFAKGNTSMAVVRTPTNTSVDVPSGLPPTNPLEAREVPPDDLMVEASNAGDLRSAETQPDKTIVSTTLPPREPSLRRSLARLESFVRPELFGNEEGGAEGPQGIVSFDTRGHDLGPYIRQILAIIERNWKNNIPSAAGLPGMAGATFVKLSIHREQLPGNIQVARIMVDRTWTSTIQSFDRAALFALEISSPLPPLPANFPYDSMDGRLGFLYNLEPSQVQFPRE